MQLTPPKSLLILIFTCASVPSALACKYLDAKRIQFQPGVVELSHLQVAELAEWVHRAYKKWPIMSEVQIQVDAYHPSKKDADRIAKEREKNVVRTLKALMPTKPESWSVFSQGVPVPGDDQFTNYDITYLVLTPDVEKLKLPDCNPRPAMPESPGRSP